jgi:hypothetical protein
VHGELHRRAAVKKEGIKRINWSADLRFLFLFREWNRWMVAESSLAQRRKTAMSIGVIILIVLIILCWGGFSGVGDGPSMAPAITAAVVLVLSSSS